MQFWEKNIQHPKKSIFNDWSVSENQFNIVFYNKIYTIKNVSCWKKSQGGSIYNIKLLSQISKYSYSFSIKHEHAHEVVVKNGSCNTSHSKCIEQAFYTEYTGK